MKYNAVLFDLDGTLTDSFQGITRSVEYALNRMNIEVNSREDLRKFIGPTLRYSFAEFYGMSGEELDKAVNFYRSRYKDLGWKENALYPDTENMLKRLYEKGYKIFIASSKPKIFVQRILEHFKIDKYFVDICGSDLVGGLQEKDEIMEYVIKNNNLDPNKTVMVGDRLFDAQGAINNKTHFIGALYGFGSYEELSKYPNILLAETTTQIADFLCNE